MTGSSWRVPANVVDAVRRRWTTGEAWSREVEFELESLCEKFDARPISVFTARYGFVVAAEAPTGQLILRASADPNAGNEALVSQALARLGVGPAVHDVIDTATGVWTVMERVVPGTSLARVTVGSWTLPALVALFRPMLGKPAPSADLPLVTTWLRQRLLDGSPDDLAPGRQVATVAERQQALSLLDGLGEPAGICHADASTDNVLLDERGSFRLIDPRGMRGDVAYDVAVVALKFGKYVSPPRVAETLGHALDLDRGRLNAWMAVADAARV